MKANDRDYYFQTVRGICMLAVILIHCPTVAVGGDLFENFEQTYNLFVRTLLAFPVAILFYLSGRFTKIKGQISSYIKKRLGRLIIPYVVWTFAYILFGVIRGNKLTVGGVIETFLTGNAAMPFYYTICLIWMTLLTPILIKWINSRKLIFGVLALSMLMQVIGYVVMYRLDESEYVKYTPIWLGFYVVGIAVGYGKIDVGNIFKEKTLILICCGAYIISLIESCLLQMITPLEKIAFSQWHFGAFLYAWSLILLMESYRNKGVERANKLLGYIGDRSYGIYLIHCFFISTCNAVISRIPYDFPLPFERLAVFGVTAVGSLVVIEILKRCFPQKYQQLILGI